MDPFKKTVVMLLLFVIGIGIGLTVSRTTPEAPSAVTGR
jgi:uncharacterized membrane protein